MALSVEPGFFLATPGTGRSGPASLEPHYRSLRATTQITRNQATAYAWLVHDIAAVFERHVEMPDVDFPVYKLEDHDTSGIVDSAKAVREAWDLRADPIKHVLRLAENRGIVCVFSPFRIASVDAYSFESGVRPIIVLNPLKGDYYRQRWDLAHEIGHLILHRDAEPGSHAVEAEANRFAAEFLLPGQLMLEQLPRRPVWPRLQTLKEHWGVSMQALLYRGRELGVYSDVTYRNAMQRMSQEGWRRQEPGPRPSMEQPSLFPGALSLLEDSGIPPAQLASEARVPMNIFQIITARNVETIASGRTQPDESRVSEKEQEPSGVISLLTNPLQVSTTHRKRMVRNMAFDDWPPLSVRRWQQVLAMRDPSWGWQAEDYDDISGAAESRRMHELRGVIVGQVAEIENLLIFIADQIRARVTEIPQPAKQGRRPVGQVLASMESQLRALGLEEEFAASIKQIRQTISERNAIVHAVIQIGYSDLGAGGRDSVISILWDNNEIKRPGKIHECENFEECPHDLEDFYDWSWDISEFRLEKQLSGAYEALGKCIDIWMRLDEILPEPKPFGA